MASSLSPHAKNLALDAAAADWAYLSIHDGDPGTTGANEVTGSTRTAVTWNAAASAAKAIVASTGSPVRLPVPAGKTVTFVGMFSAATGGNFGGCFDQADEAFNLAGYYEVTGGSVTLP